MWVCIRISNRWKTQKIVQIKLDLAPWLQTANANPVTWCTLTAGERWSRGTAGTFSKETSTKLGLAFTKCPERERLKGCPYLLLFPMFLFSPEDAKIFIQLLCFNAALERDWKYFTALLKVWFLWRKKKKTKDLRSWVNFNLKLSSAVRQHSRVLLKQRCACCHTLLCAFLDAHSCRY